MKEIQVKISAKEWAEKRMQYGIAFSIANQTVTAERVDELISACGFILDE